MMTPTATQLVYYQQTLGKMGLGFKHSANVDYYELGNVAYKIELGALQAFSYLQCFDRFIWVSILISIIILSIFTTLANYRMNEYLIVFWSYFVILFSKEIPKYCINGRLSQIFLLSGWLMAALMLSINFSAEFFDKIILVIPYEKIKGWEDLYKKSNIQIIAFTDCPLRQFALSNESAMAINFNSRLSEEIELGELKSGNPRSIYDRLKSGRSALIRKKVALHHIIKRFSNLYSDEDFLEQIHVSEDGGGYMPFFIPVKRDINKYLLKRLDEV